MGKSLHPSSSNEQQSAEPLIIKRLENQLKKELGIRVKLIPHRPLPDCLIKVDGYCEQPRIMCEIWFHQQDLPKGRQPDKVMSDALKMLFIEKRLGKSFRKILVFADEKVGKPFHPDRNKWEAKCLKTFGIECRIIEPRPDMKNKIINAQQRQAASLRGS